MNGIKEVSYELYKQHWIDNHTTREQRLDDIRNWAETEIENNDETMTCSYEECREEFGYAGEIYVCYDEFLDWEYKDEYFMKEILSSEKLIEAYEKDITQQ